MRELQIMIARIVKMRPGALSGGLAALAAVACLLGAPAQAVSFGYFTNKTQSISRAQAAVTGAGQDFTRLDGLSAADLAGHDVIWATNGSNSGQLGALEDNIGAVRSFVEAGGVFIYHDRRVNGFDALWAIDGFTTTRDFDDSINIDAGAGVDLLGAGFDADTLDGGNVSSHGFSTVTGGAADAALPVLTRTDSDRLVDVVLRIGLGDLYYSTVPLDYPLSGKGGASRAAFLAYAATVVDAGARLSLGNRLTVRTASPPQVPLPLPGVLLATGMALLGWRGLQAGRRRR